MKDNDTILEDAIMKDDDETILLEDAIMKDDDFCIDI